MENPEIRLDQSTYGWSFVSMAMIVLGMTITTNGNESNKNVGVGLYCLGWFIFLGMLFTNDKGTGSSDRSISVSFQNLFVLLSIIGIVLGTYKMSESMMNPSDVNLWRSIYAGSWVIFGVAISIKHNRSVVSTSTDAVVLTLPGTRTAMTFGGVVAILASTFVLSTNNDPMMRALSSPVYIIGWLGVIFSISMVNDPMMVMPTMEDVKKKIMLSSNKKEEKVHNVVSKPYHEEEEEDEEKKVESFGQFY